MVSVSAVMKRLDNTYLSFPHFLRPLHLLFLYPSPPSLSSSSSILDLPSFSLFHCVSTVPLPPEQGSPAFEDFLSLLGKKVKMKGFTKYRAQLDNKSKCH